MLLRRAHRRDRTLEPADRLDAVVAVTVATVEGLADEPATAGRWAVPSSRRVLVAAMSPSRVRTFFSAVSRCTTASSRRPSTAASRLVRSMASATDGRRARDRVA